MLADVRRRALLALALITAALVALGPLARFADYLRQRDREQAEEPIWWARMLDLSTEANVPTWWSATLLAGLATLFLLAGALRRFEGGSLRPHAVLASVATALSIDEGVAFHEEVLGAVGDAVVDGSGLLQFTWIVPGAAVAAIGGLLTLWASSVLPADVRRTLAAGGAVFLAGALGVEAVTGAVFDARGHDRWYLLATTVEEGLEFAGVLVALSGASRLLQIEPGPGGGIRLTLAGVVTATGTIVRRGAANHDVR